MTLRESIMGNKRVLILSLFFVLAMGTATVHAEATAATTCACASGFTGATCEVPPVAPVCAPNPCKNEGTCGTDKKGAMTCTCTDGYEGKTCEQKVSSNFEKDVDTFFAKYFVTPIADVFFIKVGDIISAIFQMPLVVAWLLFGALFFTFKMGFVNFRMFGHAIALVRGKFDKPDSPGEVSHFQALTTALSATVGLGNIAGVAIAVSIGGPGATFWMIVVGIIGMSAKFAEVTLGQKYRVIRPDGQIMGGAMYYLSQGLSDIGKPTLGKFLAAAFVILCIGASFGGGNAFQVKQSLGQIETQIPWLAGIENQELDTAKLDAASIQGAMTTFVSANGLHDVGDKNKPIVLTLKVPKGAAPCLPNPCKNGGSCSSNAKQGSYATLENTVIGLTGIKAAENGRPIVIQLLPSANVDTVTLSGRGASRSWVYGLIMMILVGIVIIGGIKRIASVADKIVPIMCSVYVLVCLYILLANFGDIGAAVATIFESAFSGDAAKGGFIGVLIIGVKRAVFSNEAGIGSAAIAHSAAKVEFPVQEGIVSILEPFIDTVVICTMTALVIVITGAHDVTNPEFAGMIKAEHGAALTSAAMATQVPWFSVILSVAVFLFAYSTMISWSYYGERCWSYLFGDRSSMIYRILFLAFVFLGSIMTATNILIFSDLMILGMAFPNILGVFLLSGGIRKDLDAYTAKLKSGEVKPTK
jgi:Na+/alanine symporter